MIFFKNLAPAGNMPVPTIGNEINGRFQATIELNKAGSSEEIVEFYDGLANIGIAIQRINGNTIRSYAYYGLNEGYFISGFFLLNSQIIL